MADNHFKVNRGLSLIPQAGAPANPSNGDLYYDSSLGKFRKYEAGSWSDLSTSGAVTDTAFEIDDAGDPTKKITFDAGGTTGTKTTITAAQTANRVVTLPDATTTLLGADTAQVVTAKDIDGGTASNTNRITLPSGATSALNALTRKAGTLLFDTTKVKPVYDNGSALKDIGSGSGGAVNFLGLTTTWSPDNTDDRDAETSVGNWVAYADAASTSPVDMTGGSPNTTIARSTTTPMNGAAHFLMTVSSGASRQGEGVSCVANIPPAYRGRTVTFSFPYKITGSVVEDDFRLFVYDVTNSEVITPTSYSKILGSSGLAACILPIKDTTAQIRVGIHVARSSTAAATITFDDVSIGPMNVARGMAGSDVMDYSNLISFGAGFGTVTNKRIYARRVGDSLHVVGTASAGTTSNASTGEVLLPAGMLIDASKLGTVSTALLGQAVDFSSASAAQVFLPCFFDGSTVNTVYISDRTASGAFQKRDTNAYITANTAFTFEFIVPIAGWSANVNMADSSAFSILPYLVNGTRVTTTPTKLGEYRCRIRGASVSTYTDTTTGAITLADGAPIYSSNWATAGTSGQPNKWDIYIGKNKVWRSQMWKASGRSTMYDTTPNVGNVTTEHTGVLETYDSSTGVLTLTPWVTPNTTSGARIGFNDVNDAGGSGFFDVLVADNILSLGFQIPRSTLKLTGIAGFGSTNTKVPYFSTVETNVGTAFSFSNSTTLGLFITILEDGIYQGSFVGGGPASGSCTSVVRKNASTLFTTNASSLTAGQFEAASVGVGSAGAPPCVATPFGTFYPAGTVLSFQTDGATPGTPQFTSVSITKVST